MCALIKKQRPPKGKFILRKDNDSELLAIVLQYTINGKIAKTTFGEKVREDQWDAKNQKVKNNHTSHNALNKRLTKYRNEYDCLILEAFKEKQHITIDKVRYILANKRLSNSKSIIEIGKDLLSMRKEHGRIGISAYLNGVNSLNVFEQFLKEKTTDDINTVHISEALINKYVSWRLNTRKNSHETINKSLTPLYMIGNNLYAKGLLSLEELERIKKCTLSKERLSLNACDIKEIENQHLSHDDFHKLLEYQKNCNVQLTVNYIDMFHFSILTGLRLSDIVTLEWDNIDFDNNLLRKVLVKSKRKHTHVIKLTDDAINILRQWQEKPEKRRFVFGLLEDNIDLNDDKLLRERLQSKNHSINRVLKKVCDKIGISQRTFHKGRHTYAMWPLHKER